MTEQQIKELMNKYLEGKLSKKEELLLEQFDSALFGKNLGQAKSGLSNKRNSLHHIHRKINRAKSNYKKTWVPIAASIILLIGVGYFSLDYWWETPETAPIAQVVKTTPWGKRMNLQLADGTKIYLNTGSSIEFPELFSDSLREVQLEGEAFFEVAKDAARPFVITSDGIKTTVLGTSFNVNTYAENTEIKVTVKSGKVRIASEDHQVFLGANQQGVFDKNTQKIHKSSISTNNFFDWKDGILKFEDVSIKEVCVALERWYGVKFHFENASVMDCHLTATYKNEPLTAVLESIIYTKKGLKYHFINEREILIKGRCTD